MAKFDWKTYLRKTLYVIAVLLLILLLVFLWDKQKEQICEEVEIEVVVPQDRMLLNRQMIQDSINLWYNGGLVGLPSSMLDIHELEQRILGVEAVRNAQVSLQLNGVLRISIDQRIPIVRLYSSETSSYYLDILNKKISARPYLAARVPIASGALDETMSKKVYTLASYVQENPFAEALVEQIFVTDEKDLILIPKLHSHRVIIGDAVDLEDKFNRLQKFYKHGMNKVGWDEYKTINLKYANQIVCD